VHSRRFYLNKCCEFKQRSLHADNAIIYWRVAWTSSRICAGQRQTLRATIVTIFSHMTTDVSVFVKFDTIFRFFCELPQIRTSNFCKVVRQHTEGMVGLGSIIWVLLKMYFSCQQWKNLKNPLIIEVIAMSLVVGIQFRVSFKYALVTLKSREFC